MSSSTEIGSDINLADYCKDPAKYSSQPQHVKDMYTFRCKMVEEIKKNLETSAGQRVGESLLDMIGQLPYMMTYGMITDPSQLSMWFLTDKFALTQSFWQKNATKVFNFAKVYMKNWGTNWVSKMVVNGGKLIAPGAKISTGAGRYLLNRVALGRALQRATFAVVNITTGIVRNTVRGFLMLVGAKIVAMAALAFIMTMINKIFLVQMLLQMVGMIVDTIDPCNLNKALDADSIAQFAQSMDTSFKQMMIPQETIIPSADDSIHYINKWPIDIEVEKLFPTNARNDPGDSEDYKKSQLAEFGLSEDRLSDLESLHMEYQWLYLINLRFNFFGQPLSFPEKYEPPDVTPKMLNAMENHVLASFASNNVVASRWLFRYSPIILFAILMALFFIYRFI